VQLALSVAALLGVAASVIGVVLAFFGSVVHRRWHSVLALDAGAFPQPFDAALVSGLYSLQTAVPMIPSVLAGLRLNGWLPLAVALLFAGACVVIRRLQVRRFTWLTRIMLTASVLSLAHFVLWLSVASMRAVAESGIQEIALAAKTLRLVGGSKAGCPQGLSRRFHCVTVWKGDQMIASGLMVSASEKHIVLIDPAFDAPRLLELNGLEIRGRLP
jgi:hypothetical protein